MFFPNHVRFPLQIVKNSKMKWHIVTKSLNIVSDLPKNGYLKFYSKHGAFSL